MTKLPETDHPLPDLGELLPEERLLAGIPGIYFLLNAGRVVYIGQSSDIHSRLKQHRKDPKKRFSQVLWYHMGCWKSRLRWEAILIFQYLPCHNRRIDLGITPTGGVYEVGFRAPRKGAK